MSAYRDLSAASHRSINWQRPINWRCPWAKGLVLCMPYNPLWIGSGQWRDVSGRNNHGTLSATDMPRSISPKGSFGSLDVDASKYVTLTPAGGALDQITGSMSIACWWKKGSASGDSDLISNLGNSNQRGVFLQARRTNLSNNEIRLGLSSTGGDIITQQSQTNVHTDDWMHVVGVYDADALTMTIWLNGRDITNPVVTVPASQDNDNNVPWVVGQRATLGGNVTTGQITDVMIWDRAINVRQFHRDARRGYADLFNRWTRTPYWFVGDAGIVNIMVDSASHAHTADGTTITQSHAIAADDASHGHTADNTTISQTHAVTAADAVHSHTAENTTISQAAEIAPADADHAHAADETSITQTHAVVAADSVHSHAAEATTISQQHEIAAADCDHGHTADGTTVTQAHAISPADAAHAHAADASSITQTQVIAAADSLHSHTAENTTVDQGTVITVASASHAHAGEGTTITQAHAIEPADALHSHTAEQPAISQTHLVTVADAHHGHVADATTISQGAPIEPADAVHGHTAANATISQTHVISVSDAWHGHTADEPSLTQAHAVTVADCWHGHAADNVTVSLGALVIDVFGCWRGTYRPTTWKSLPRITTWRSGYRPTTWKAEARQGALP